MFSRMCKGSMVVAVCFLGLIAANGRAHAAPAPGWYDLGGNRQMFVLSSAKAREYADIVFERTPVEQKLNKLAKFLANNYTPWGKALNVARWIVYNGWRDIPMARIYWCSSVAPVVRIYHWKYLPYWADPDR